MRQTDRLLKPLLPQQTIAVFERMNVPSSAKFINPILRGICETLDEFGVFVVEGVDLTNRPDPQVLLRCKRLCCVARGRAALQEVMLRCKRCCCVARGRAALREYNSTC